MAKTKKYSWKDPDGLTAAVIAVMIYDALWSATGAAISLYWGAAAEFDPASGEALDLPQFAKAFHDLFALLMLLLLIVPVFWLLRVSKNAHVLKGYALENSPMFTALW